MSKKKPKQTKAARNAAAKSIVDGTARVVKLLDTYEDDHIACAALCVDGVLIDLPWCGPGGVRAACYWGDSPSAKRDLAEYVRDYAEIASDEDDPFGPMSDCSEDDE